MTNNDSAQLIQNNNISVQTMHQKNADQQNVPAEETPSPLLGGEQRIHHVYLCHLQLMFCKNNLLVVCYHCPVQQVEMDPSVLAANKV